MAKNKTSAKEVMAIIIIWLLALLALYVTIMKFQILLK